MGDETGPRKALGLVAVVGAVAFVAVLFSLSCPEQPADRVRGTLRPGAEWAAALLELQRDAEKDIAFDGCCDLYEGGRICFGAHDPKHDEFYIMPTTGGIVLYEGAVAWRAALKAELGRDRCRGAVVELTRQKALQVRIEGSRIAEVSEVKNPLR
jgi:hypothetical protein